MEASIFSCVDFIRIEGPYSNAVHSSYYLIKNTISDQYFEFGENEAKMLELIIDNAWDEAREYSQEVYQKDVVEEFVQFIQAEGILSRKKTKMKKKSTELALPLPKISRWLSTLDWDHPKYLAIYRLLGQASFLGFIYHLVSLLYRVPLNSFAQWSVVLRTILCLIPTILVHEMGHILRLQMAGKKANNVRLYFNYLTFEFGLQANVSAVYELENKFDRMGVSFAGCQAQIIFATILVTFFRITGQTINDSCLLLFLLANLILVVTNLIPFAKLDGYWVLSHFVEINNLNSKCQVALKDWIRSKLLKRSLQLSQEPVPQFPYKTYALLNNVYETVGTTLVFILFSIYANVTISTLSWCLYATIILYKVYSFFKDVFIK